MNKSQLLDYLASKFNYLPNNEVEKIFSKIINSFSESLATNDRIEIRGFGTFSIKERSKRTARNPKTGEKINVEPKKSLHFKTSKEMRKLLNEK